MFNNITMLNIDNLTYSYHRRQPDAVADATASIGPGVHLLVGENGAGKTTLLYLMGGLLKPDSGTCRLDGEDVASRRPATQSRIFFLADNFESPFPTVNAMARTHGCFYPDFNFEMLRANLEDFGLTGDEKLADMSLGMRRKSYLAYALAMGVELLLLDEPANGMDIGSKKCLRRMISRCTGDDRTVIISTHNVHELGMIFDSVMVMRCGRLKLAMPVWEILEKVAFVSSASPVPGAIFQEPEQGRFKAIIPNEDGIETDIDYGLFYSAANARVGEMFLDFLKNYKTPRHDD